MLKERFYHRTLTVIRPIDIENFLKGMRRDGRMGLSIRQAVKIVKGTVSIGSPKSKDSIRDIPVPLNVRPCAIKLRDTTDQFIWSN